MVLSKNTFCWKNSLATHIFPTQQKSIMLCDVDVSCICTHGRCHVMLTSLALTHMVRAARCGPNVLSSAAWPAVSPEIGPRFPRHGAGNRLRRKSVPNLGRAWGEPNLLPFGCKLVSLQLEQIRVASAAIPHHLLHSHRLRSRPDQIQNPNSKIQNPNGPFGFWSLDFGVWILDFGFWILDLGFWIWDFGFWISLVFVLFVAAPNGAVWSLDLGFWILDFGFGLGLPCIVWILHKIFPCHADSGRRIFIDHEKQVPTKWDIFIVNNQDLIASWDFEWILLFCSLGELSCEHQVRSPPTNSGTF